LAFVEFLELVGRLAEVKYKDQPEILEEPLLARCGYILDLLFECVGASRQKVEEQQSDFTESDDDY